MAFKIGTVQIIVLCNIVILSSVYFQFASCAYTWTIYYFSLYPLNWGSSSCDQSLQYDNPNIFRIKGALFVILENGTVLFENGTTAAMPDYSKYLVNIEEALKETPLTEEQKQHLNESALAENVTVRKVQITRDFVERKATLFSQQSLLLSELFLITFSTTSSCDRTSTILTSWA